MNFRIYLCLRNIIGKIEIQSPDLQLQRELIFLSISKYKTDRTTSPRFITKYQNIRRQTN